MGFIQSADYYFTYESRLASFRKTHSVSRRRASNASARGPKSLKWPHKFLSTQELAKAGFFYLPTQVNLDNVSCFLCHKSLDGWEENDDPLAEHLRHSPECGWAITATIERSDGDWSEEDPFCTKILEARKATFSDKWPHENKKGWKCHVRQMIEAGWKYTPTPESDDMVTCSYCNLALSNWGKNDKPFEKHCERSPDCPFFAMQNSSKQNIRIKNTNLKRARVPRISRLSAQSNLTVTTNASREESLPVEEDESIMTMTSVTSQKTLQEQKLAPIKVRRTRSKKNETGELIGREVTAQRVRGSNTCRKTNIKESQPIEEDKIDHSPKMRITRNRGSIAVDKNCPSSDAVFSQQTAKTRSKIISNPKNLSTSNKLSAKPASPIDDSAIERSLEADLLRTLTDDDKGQEIIKTRVTMNSINAISNLEPIDKDEEEVIEAETITKNREAEVPNPSNAKGSPYTKQNIDPKELAEKVSQQLENQYSILQGAVVPDRNPSPHDLLPQTEPIEKGRISNRQATRILPNRKTRGSTLSTKNNDSTNSITTDLENDSENRTLNQSNCNLNDLFEQQNEKEWCSENIKKTNDDPKSPGSSVVAQGSNRPNKRKKPSQNVETDAARSESGGPSEQTSGEKIVENVVAESFLSKKKICNGLSKEILSPASSRRLIRANSKKLISKSQDSTSHSPEYSTTPPVDSASLKEATSHPTLYSDTENQPPSPKDLMSISNLTTPPKTRRVVIVNSATPLGSLHRPTISVGGLISDQPWTAIDADTICVKSPSNFSTINLTRNITTSVENDPLEHAFEKARQGELSSLEEKMTVAEWIKYNAQLAEEKLRHECECMVNNFEREGTRAIRALEGVECLE